MSDLSLAAAAALPRVPLDLLQPYARQARKTFDDEALQGLAESIKARGVVQPIVIRPIADSGRYEILAGERRWRASKLAGAEDIPVIVRGDLSDQDADVLHLVENLQRADLSLAETCEAVRELVREVGVSKAATELGQSEAWVSKRTGVLDMPAVVQDLVRDAVVVDLEIIGTLAQIHKLDADEADELAQELREPDPYNEPLNRQTMRELLNRLKASKQREAEQAKHIPTAAAEEHGAAEDGKEAKREAAAAKKAKERERQIARVKDDRKALKDEVLASAQQSLGLTDKQMGGFAAPLRVDYCGSDFAMVNYSSTAKFPLSADACNYEMRSNGDVATLRHVAAGLRKPPLISVQVPQLTLEQAAALEAALPDVDMHLWFDETISGKELRSFAKQLAANPVSPEKQGDLLIATFIAERVDRSDALEEVKAADLHAAYVKWCAAHKTEPVPINNNFWGAAIAAAGIEKTRRKTGYHYCGCKLR